ncbi:hypothetical protein [Yersinia aldovae]|uniref:hypothetical protein n=1 Tax=Yersinia aldovae TaxID=29483 RepID=UPI0011A6C7B5|nr:hypothetical protein [Yersinia aldovae]
MTDEIKTGGPAFPNVPDGAGDKWQDWDMGMTLRDYFAAKAMQELCAADSGGNVYSNVEQAYVWADAMIKARG